jgi:hypothetical protein
MFDRKSTNSSPADFIDIVKKKTNPEFDSVNYNNKFIDLRLNFDENIKENKDKKNQLEVKKYINKVINLKRDSLNLNQIKITKNSYGKFFSSLIAGIMVFGLFVMPISIFNYSFNLPKQGENKFLSGIFNRKNNAQAATNEVNKSQSNSKNSIKNNDYRIPLPDFSWVFTPSNDQIEKNSDNDTLNEFNKYNTEVERISNEGKETAKINGNFLPKTTSENNNTTSESYTGRVVIRENLSNQILSNKFSEGENITLIYNNKEYNLKVTSNSIMDSTTILIINQQLAQEIFNQKDGIVNGVVVKSK